MTKHPNYMYNHFQIYVSSMAFETFSEAVDYCMKNGLHLEITNFYNPEEYDKLPPGSIASLEKLLKTYPEVKTILHGFFSGLDPSTSNPKLLKETTRRALSSINLAKRLQCHKVVFHTGYRIFKTEPYDVSAFLTNSKTFWRNILNTAHIDNLTLLLENTYDETPDLLNEIITDIGSPSLRICLDTGHVNRCSKISLQQFYNSLKSTVSHLHCHNNHTNMDAHNSLLDGTIDFKSFFSLLKSCNTSPTVTLELFDRAALQESLEFISSLR